MIWGVQWVGLRDGRIPDRSSPMALLWLTGRIVPAQRPIRSNRPASGSANPCPVSPDGTLGQQDGSHKTGWPVPFDRGSPRPKSFFYLYSKNLTCI